MFEEPMLFAESACEEAAVHSLETKNAELERTIFDLKMRLYYLSSNRTGGDDDSLSSMLREKDAELLSMKDMNDAGKRRIFDLENEVLLLKTSQTGASQSSSAILQQQLQLEHSLRSERQAAIAIAEHDNGIIADLESELERAKKKRDEDKRIISELVDKVSLLLKTVEGSESKLKEAQELSVSKDNMIEALTLRLEQQATTVEAHTHTHSNAEKTSMSLPRKLSMSTFISDTAKQQFYSPLGSPDKDDDESSHNLTKEWSDLTNLRSQVSHLTELLDREHRMRRAQDEALDSLRSSAEEVTLLEAEEIARLESELELVITENKSLIDERHASNKQLDYMWNRLAENDALLRRENIDPIKGVLAKVPPLSERSMNSDVFSSSGYHTYPRSSPKRVEAQIPHTIELYRMREAELVDALEGVVNRCRELEGMLHESHMLNNDLRAQIERSVSDNVYTATKNTPHSLKRSLRLNQSQFEEQSDVGSILFQPEAKGIEPNSSVEKVKSRSATIAAEARLAMSNILKSPTGITPEEIQEEKTFVDITEPKFCIGSRLSFLWSSSLLPGKQIPWPGIVVDTNTSLRCNVPSDVNLGDKVDIALGNGKIEKVSYIPGQSFSICGNRLQIPMGVKPGKSIVWNNVKGGIGFRWYDIQLDKCDHITRAFDKEVREVEETDITPDRTMLQSLLSQNGDTKYESNVERRENESKETIASRAASPLTKHFLKSLAMSNVTV